MSAPTVEERFWPKVAKAGPGDCWPWLGAHNGTLGHGQLTVLQRRAYAHRVSWELANGPIPDGLQVLHHCDNPPCVNPAHLFLGTQKDNIADMLAKGRGGHGKSAKPHCPSGHPLSGENLYVPPGTNQRQCRRCRREASRRYSRKVRA